jgi:hypothetical protein
LGVPRSPPADSGARSGFGPLEPLAVGLAARAVGIVGFDSAHRRIVTEPIASRRSEQFA